jgi:hypothetical protein
MKRIVVLLTFSLFLLMASTASAQLRKVPAVVTEALKAKYPDAQNVSWDDNITNFEASFELDNHQQTASFTKKGTWKRTEKTLREEELPDAVKEGLSKSKYTDWEIQSYKEIIESSGKHQYRLLVKKNDVQKKYLFFNTEGVLIRDAITI